MEKYIVLEKKIGETPLSCAEAFRAKRPDLLGIPLSYAGRLDPMASGKLLVLIGEECKHQSNYRDLDKEYEFSVLFGVSSDTQDVLGRLTTEAEPRDQFLHIENIEAAADSLVGELTVPYPLFSAKTVNGKPLHMWTLEGRLDEIKIPTRTSNIYELILTGVDMLSRTEITLSALEKIETIPKVTDPRKALGNDFRRVDVRQDWKSFSENTTLPEEFTIASFRCTASSGTYMRTLATIIAEKLHTTGLAWHIHRTKMGIYNRDNFKWTVEY
jgi:tRNA pseudouridine(55) synthase